MPQIDRTDLAQKLGHRSAPVAFWLNVDVPPPSPDVVPLPPTPLPLPPMPMPPDITEPLLPGQNEPVRDPSVPPPWHMGSCMH